MLDGDFIRALDATEFSRHVGIEPDEWQAEVLRFEGRRMLLNCSRQSGKSTTTAIKALHTGIYRPSSLILLTSPGMRQSQELFRKVKAHYHRLAVPPSLLEDNKLSMTLSNGSRIISLPGDPTTVRGFSNVTLILEDEAAQVDDSFYQAVLPMLIVSGGALICMSTPFGRRGHFFEEWTNGGDDWHRIEIPAGKCPRITPEDLEEQRRRMGDMFFRQEYLCQFEDTVNSSFSYDLIQRALDDEVQPLFQEDAWARYTG